MTNKKRDIIMIDETDISKVIWTQEKANKLTKIIGEQSIRDIALRADISHQTIYRLLNFKSDEVSYVILKKLAFSLSVNISEFVQLYLFSDFNDK